MSRARPGWVLALASAGSFMVVLDMLIVATALTEIRTDLGASLEDLEWTLNAYTLSFAVLLMTGAVLGDRFGRRRVFAGGLALFALASAGCALAPDVGVLIAARTVQGAGAAALMPVALALLNSAYPPERRGRAVGIYGSLTGLGVALGPVLGGVVTQHLGWEWIFWLNLPVALVAVPLVLTRIPESHGPGTALDPRGLTLATVAALGLAWGLVRGEAAGWGSPEILGALAAGALATVVFVLWERRAPAPMLPPRLFRSRAFSAGNAAIFLTNASVTGAVFLMAQFQQVANGHAPLGAGLRLLPWGVSVVLLAPLAGSLSDRLGERPLAVAGLLLQTAGMAWIAVIAAPRLPFPSLLVPMTLAGIGFAFAIPALTRSVTSTVAPPDIGRAAGTFSTMRQFGGAFGVAAHGTAFSAAGGYASVQDFTAGFTAALALAAALAFTGALAALALVRGHRSRTRSRSSYRVNPRPPSPGRWR
ncbi:MFS transporter [Spirillospora sp. NPDC047279]|uniref:MFS transporter n=1 Tax=Spirillospora sp. NPDC047279 TaxID=3155478 RepID=UPI0033E75B1C